MTGITKGLMTPPKSSSSLSNRLDAGAFPALIGRILSNSRAISSPIDYLRAVATELRLLTDADVAELRQIEGTRFYRARSWETPLNASQVQVHRCAVQGDRFLPVLADHTLVESLSRDLLTGAAGRLDAVSPGGVYRSGDIRRDAPFGRKDAAYPVEQGTGVSSSVRSLLIVPLVVEGEVLGLLRFRSRSCNAFDPVLSRFLEDTAPILGVVLMRHRSERLQRERVKELACLYGLVRVLRESPEPWENRMDRIVRLLPPAWQYPDIASATIAVDDQVWRVGPEGECAVQKAPIHAQGRERGVVEIRYVENRVVFDEGPFLKEERDLLDAVARQIGAALEQREVQAARDELADRLYHADRLATLGVMAAEIAHEINEPLGGILGFAQLARKASGLPPEAAADLDRITASSLHARDIVQRMLGFARRLQPARAELSLNDVVRSVLDFVSPRMRGQNLTLKLDLAETCRTSWPIACRSRRCWSIWW